MIIYIRFMYFEGENIDVKCQFYCIISKVHISNTVIKVDVDHDHLAKQVLSGFSIHSSVPYPCKYCVL